MTRSGAWGAVTGVFNQSSEVRMTNERVEARECRDEQVARLQITAGT